MEMKGIDLTSTYVNWGNGKVKLTWVPGVHILEENLITSTHGFCFYNGQLLLVNLNSRGWDIPGGHIELDETPEECFRREAMEEGYVEGKCSFLGYIEISHNENPNWREDSPYPKVGYQIYYRMDIDQLHDFSSEYESSQRILIDPGKTPSYHHEWHEILGEILDYALLIKET